MHMSSQRYINAASENIYICILIYNTFRSAAFYNDPPVIRHAVAQEHGPQKVKMNVSVIMARHHQPSLSCPGSPTRSVCHSVTR